MAMRSPGMLIGGIITVSYTHLDVYKRQIVNQLEVFSEETVIQRLTGDGGRDSLVGPLWSLKKFVVLNEIDKLMVKRDTYQGVKYGE